MSLLSAFAGVIVLAGVGLLGTAVYVVRSSRGHHADENGPDSDADDTGAGRGPGTRSLAVFVVLLGVAAVGTGVLVLVSGVRANGAPTRDATIWLTQFVELAALAWLVFALRYTGRGSLLTRRRLVGLVGVYVLLWAPLVTGGFSGVLPSVAEETLSVMTSLYGIGLTLLATTLLVQTVSRHGYLSSWLGIALAGVGFIPWLLSMLGLFAFAGAPSWVFAAVYALGFACCWLLLASVVSRPGTLGGTTATQAVGRRALVQQTEALVFVADADGRLVDINDHVQRALGVDRDTACGMQLSTLLETGIASLKSGDTFELRTRRGVRQYDVELLSLTTTEGRSVGWLVSLRDVTRRRQREQRLDVLNRILRHNIRNKLSIVLGRVEMVAGWTDDPEHESQLRTALDAVDALDELSTKAGTLEATLENGLPLETADVAAVVESVVADLRDVYPDGEFSLSYDGDTSVTTHEKLVALAIENAVENALEHTDSPVVEVAVVEDDDGVRVRVDDNGPGIPETEVAAIRRGEETSLEHGSGIGLWIIEWATTACGGTVTFTDGPAGSRVELWLPDLSAGAP